MFQKIFKINQPKRKKPPVESQQEQSKDKRLRVTKILFYASGYEDFSESYFRINEKLAPDEQVSVDDMDDIQRTLFFLPAVIGQNRNGGMGQVLFNGYGEYVRASIQGLREVQQDELANLLALVCQQYQTMSDSEEVIEAKDFRPPSEYTKEQLEELNHNFIMSSMIFDQKLKDKLGSQGLSLDTLSSAIFELDYQALDVITRYIQERPLEYCLDELGNAFDLSFTGTYSNHGEFPSYVTRYELPIVNGKPHGEGRTYIGDNPEVLASVFLFEQGVLKNVKTYHKGCLQKENDWSEAPKYITTTEYSDNGKPAKKYTHARYDRWKRVGEETEWYENGNIYHVRYYNEYSHKTKMESYFENGRLHSVKKFTKKYDGHAQIVDAWDDDGDQTVKDGEGIYFSDGTYRLLGRTVRDNRISYYEVSDGVFNGLRKDYEEGYLVYETDYVDGKEHGFWRHFDKNGNVMEEVRYQNGLRVAEND